MSKGKTIIKISTIFLLLCLSIISLIFFAVPAIASSLNTKIGREEIKVFLGHTVDFPTKILKNSYISQRINLLNNKSKSTPNKSIKAVIVFNSFIEPNELRKSIDKYNLKIEEIFVAIPYTDCAGGTLLDKNMSIEDALELNIQSLEEMASEEPFNEELKLHAKLAREKGVSIYAVTAKGNAKEFKSLSDNEIVKYIDIFFHPKAEKLAKSKNLKVKYIPVPDRPDGYL